MHQKTEIAVKFLQEIRHYLENEKLMTMLAEICTDAENKGCQPDPFRILISTIMSVRNKDESTVIATRRLFDEGGYNTPEKLASAPVEEVEMLIRKSGMYKTKTKRIQDASKMIISDFGGKVPTEFDDLMKLPGVGRKVANCVLVYAYNVPCIPVDIHVHRISNRMGLVKTTKPEKTEFELMKIYPKEYWVEVNDTFVIFGKTVCRPISPKCEICPIAKECPKIIIKNVPKKKKKKTTKTKKGNKKNS